MSRIDWTARASDSTISITTLSSAQIGAYQARALFKPRGDVKRLQLLERQQADPTESILPVSAVRSHDRPPSGMLLKRPCCMNRQLHGLLSDQGGNPLHCSSERPCTC